MTRPDRDRRRGEGVAPWERPTLTELGDVKDLVRGERKGSGKADSRRHERAQAPLVG